ncbi:MAG: menaquinone biosynthetic enzyme MqnA/MqnD family protein [Planctomycetota bacterium]
MQDSIATLGVVSYLNSRPLIEGLEADDGVGLKYGVPAELTGMLEQGEVDAALIPVIDLARSQGAWKQISDAGIGCDGATLTVRIFSRVSPERITVLHADDHSHTSIVLAQLIWKHCYHRELDIVPTAIDDDFDSCESVLLIGDKVVGAPRDAFEYDVDLGQAWKQWTGLPFVFAVWAGPAGGDHSRLAQLLRQARDRGVCRAGQIAADMGPELGWPVELAAEYLTERLIYTITPAAEKGMQRFVNLANQAGLITKPGELVR